MKDQSLPLPLRATDKYHRVWLDHFFGNLIKFIIKIKHTWLQPNHFKSPSYTPLTIFLKVEPRDSSGIAILLLVSKVKGWQCQTKTLRFHTLDVTLFVGCHLHGRYRTRGQLPHTLMIWWVNNNFQLLYLAPMSVLCINYFWSCSIPFHSILGYMVPD